MTAASKWDAFISHASEDKPFVEPLAEELRKHGLGIWLDTLVLSVGDSLRRSIDEGLAKSRFGIVILSPAFFAKQWPQHELDGLVALEMEGRWNGKLKPPCHPSHRPWKSLPRFPHSHSFGDCSYLIRKGKSKKPFSAESAT